MLALLMNVIYRNLYAASAHLSYMFSHISLLLQIYVHFRLFSYISSFPYIQLVSCSQVDDALPFSLHSLGTYYRSYNFLISPQPQNRYRDISHGSSKDAYPERSPSFLRDKACAGDRRFNDTLSVSEFALSNVGPG